MKTEDDEDFSKGPHGPTGQIRSVDSKSSLKYYFNRLLDDFSLLLSYLFISIYIYTLFESL